MIRKIFRFFWRFVTLYWFRRWCHRKVTHWLDIDILNGMSYRDGERIDILERRFDALTGKRAGGLALRGSTNAVRSARGALAGRLEALAKRGSADARGVFATSQHPAAVPNTLARLADDARLSGGVTGCGAANEAVREGSDPFSGHFLKEFAHMVRIHAFMSPPTAGLLLSWGCRGYALWQVVDAHFLSILRPTRCLFPPSSVAKLRRAGGGASARIQSIADLQLGCPALDPQGCHTFSPPVRTKAHEKLAV